MYEYEIINKLSDEIRIISGYTYQDACKRSNLDPDMFEILNFEYVD